VKLFILSLSLLPVSSSLSVTLNSNSGVAYLLYNSIGNNPDTNGQWIVELDETYLHVTNRRTQIVKAAVGSEGGWLEGGGILKHGSLYYFMAGSGCCYCAGGGGAMVFVSSHPLGSWKFQTNVNPGLYLPFSPTGAPPLPVRSQLKPPVAIDDLGSPTASCDDLSGEWASSVFVPNYQPLRAGLVLKKISPPLQSSLSGIDHYNITSITETHWPAIPPAGWLLEVDRTNKTVLIVTGNHGNISSHLQPWLNPWSNGQKLSPAPDCTMIPSSNPADQSLPTMCKLPYCGESLRPVAAQQFGVLSLGGQHLYYGERWQSSLTGLKSDDFSYLAPLHFDSEGVMQRMSFTSSFTLINE